MLKPKTMRRMRPLLTVLATLGALGGAGMWMARAPRLPMPASSPNESAAAESPLDWEGDGGRGPEHLTSRVLQLPNGGPPAISCADARTILAQARAHLAASPEPVQSAQLAEAVVDWLDPHGLWSAAPDAPLLAYLHTRQEELLAELEGETGPCLVAEEAGALLVTWVNGLRTLFDQEAQKISAGKPQDAFRVLSEPVFEDRAVARPARDLARELGRLSGLATATFGDPLRPFALSARGRFFPELSAGAWGQIVLAACVRAYVPQIDPHGGWAPLDEETSLYEVDLEVSPPPRLWDQMVRTSVGVRVESGAAEPLQAKDIVLDVAQIKTGGLSVEQDEQLAIFDGSEENPHRTLMVLREGELAPRAIEVEPPAVDPKQVEVEEGLPAERVSYAEGDVLVVGIEDVPDDLGELLATTLHLARTSGKRTLKGVVLDLRGNGGGSTDGANGVLGLFLPGVPLFPMRRRDGVIEVERAPLPPDADRYKGPLAVLVDGDTASAAEMIAGGLMSYRRAVVAGSKTYGKGCAQEYLDDDSRTGILRLTTLVYALPDGSPVQKVGLFPTLSIGMAPASEREAELPHSLASWKGPDVREGRKLNEVPWPSHRGRVGPCRDEVLCKALRGLGAPRPAVARGRH